jgi:molybdenum cofactor cytidylyltransferase
VVLGHGADDIERSIEWSDELRVRNPDPARGVASTIQVGFDALAALPAVSGAFIVLGDQPRLRITTLEALAHAADRPGAQGRPFIVPRYTEHLGPHNPVLVLREAWPLVTALEGDHGLAPLIARHPELRLDVQVHGTMPDIDHPDDLSNLLQGAS